MDVSVKDSPQIKLNTMAPNQNIQQEHALLARSLGVTQLLVAINKLDAAEPAWSQVRLSLLGCAMCVVLVGVCMVLGNASTKDNTNIERQPNRPATSRWSRSWVPSWRPRASSPSGYGEYTCVHVCVYISLLQYICLSMWIAA